MSLNYNMIFYVLPKPTIAKIPKITSRYISTATTIYKAKYPIRFFHITYRKGIVKKLPIAKECSEEL